MLIKRNQNCPGPIIVSCTSWKKHIKYTTRLIKNMLNQTLQPDKIYLNLSSNEFKHMNDDLPIELIELLKNNIGKFYINWVKENTKSYKKLLPVAKLYSEWPDALILTVDEDVIYSNDYIEYMVNLAKLYPYNYVTPGTFNPYLHGYAAIYHSSWFRPGILWKIKPSYCYRFPCSDQWIIKCLSYVNITNKVVKEIESKINLIDLDHKLSDFYKKKLQNPVFNEKIDKIFNKLIISNK